jgi:dTDP-4-dehydrorhamnose 3,5-epimerase
MECETFPIRGPVLIRPSKLPDMRGFIAETFRADQFRDKVEPINVVQENHSYSAKRGTVRGLHFQTPPAAQAKLLQVVRGAIFDVAVDIRRSSPTYGRHVSVTLSDRDVAHFYVPVGFAHGFCTLEPDTVVIYKMSSYYDPAAEGGLAWDDPALGIDWPVAHAEIIVSEKDRGHPGLADLKPWFA